MKPHPIPDNQICSECGLGWSLHPDNARRRDCIDLLLADRITRLVQHNYSYTDMPLTISGLDTDQSATTSATVLN